MLPPVLRQFSETYPNVMLSMNEISSPPAHWPELRDRRLDLVLERLARPLGKEGDDLNVEVLFSDEMVIAAGVQNPFARRSKVDLTDIADEPWILMPTDSWNYKLLAQAFEERGLPPPKVTLSTFSVHIRVDLLASSRFLTVFPRSVLRVNEGLYPVKILPVALPEPPSPWPVVVVTLKHRTVSPVAGVFVDMLRAHVRSKDGLKLGKKPR